MTEDQKHKALEMYKQGIGYGTIGIRLRIGSGKIKKYLSSVTKLRGQREGYEARYKMERERNETL